jgi:hypothetical protein
MKNNFVLKRWSTCPLRLHLLIMISPYLFRYLTGITVAKYVIILIDISPTMDDQLTPFLLSYSYLQASQNISMALLGTLLQDDYVNILTFDNSQASPLNTNAVRFLHAFLKHNFIEGTK